MYKCVYSTAAVYRCSRAQRVACGASVLGGGSQVRSQRSCERQARRAGAGGVLTVKVKRVFAQGRAGGVLTVTRVFAQARAAPGSLGLHAAARRIAR